MKGQDLKIGCAVIAFMLSVTAKAEDSYSPYLGRTYATNVYWGDTHLHTNMSTDAYNHGARLGPEDAYRFAKGETILADNGMKVRLNRPLDFLVIADHGENIGVLLALANKNPALLNTESGKNWYKKIITAEGFNWGVNWSAYWEFKKATIGNETFRLSIWNEVVNEADRNNVPGKFTAFVGYEWSAAIPPPAYSGIHRVVIFREGAEKVSQVLPFTSANSMAPEDLWTYLSDYESKTGGQVLAIPHNSNLSAGRMFILEDSEGHPLSRAYGEMRARWEPLVEVTQIKGDSETHPILSPTDEFADYETRDSTNNDEDRRYEYVRSALKLGLDQQAKLGVNPFKFGLIGSTDAHTSLSAVDEGNFWGKFLPQEPSTTRIMNPQNPNLGWRMNAAGYAAVWATENTREALFAAMKRRETYATTGPRMTVRFFGGWNYQSNDAFAPDIAKTGYSRGVPMGGNLTNAPQGKAPSFLIRAVKDPDGANLDRVQVIKGWRSQNGELYEKVYNVALSNGRMEVKNGMAPLVGNTVDVADASYTNSIGDPELTVVWTDPDFDAKEFAFYYVRVIEIPTPRWTAYDAKFFNLKNVPEDVPLVTQERAYTSPIWYTPREGQ